ncbi:MAG: hypothetical protein GX250_03675 [Clostridiales bacterium]|jgi:hypothetical protein|nr:hypothetical protein [Clostridiales bacterium]
MPNNKKKNKRLGRFFRRIKISFKKHPYLFMTYFILRLLVIAIMVTQFFNGAYDSVFLCLLTLFLFTLPSFVEKRLKIDVPNTLEIMILLFIFAAEILGEIREYYIIYSYWDTMLHTVNGFLCGAIGIALIDILNRSDRFVFRLSPFFGAMVAFCFSMTIGVLWEFFEFAMDTFFQMDMQKDTIVPIVRSVMLHPEGRNIPVVVEVESLVVNGVDWNLGGYLDIGLIDTMKDLLVNFVGAAVFSVVGFFYIKNRGKGRFIKSLIPKKILEAETAEEEGSSVSTSEEGLK